MPVKLTDQQKRNLINTLLLNDVIYLLMGLFFYAAYECQLDEMIRAAIGGVSGTKTSYILYSHILIGWLLKGLTMVLPAFGWYYAYLSVCALAALSLICYVIMKRSGNQTGLTVSAVLAAFVGYECYVLPGCMKTAGVLAFAALIVFMDAAETGSIKNRGRKILIVFLAALGSMTQFSAFCMTVIVGFVSMGVYFAVKSKGLLVFRIRELRKNGIFRSFAVTVIGICFVSALVWAMDYAGYQFDGRTDAGRYRAAIIRMYGYGMGDYDAVYQDIYGIDEQEYAAIQNGSFGILDDEGWKVLERLSKDGRGLTGKKLNSYFKTVPLALFKRGMFYLWLIMLAMLLFSPAEGKLKRSMVGMEIGILLACFLTAYVFNAWQSSEAAFLLILPLLLPIFSALKDTKEADCHYLWVYLTVFSVILYSNFSSGMMHSVSEENVSERFAALASNRVNVIDLNAYLKSFGAKRVFPEGILQTGNVKVSNGAFALMEGFDGKVFSAHPSAHEEYGWIYNPKQLDVWNLVFED